MGNDFPTNLLPTLHSLETTLVLRNDPQRSTTRGWNSYGPGDHRAFEYLTPKKRLEARDLVQVGLGAARGVHLICSPARAKRLVEELLAGEGSRDTKPLMVWEPVPDLCTPQYRGEMFETLGCVDVVSPNHDELAGFFSGQKAAVEAGWERVEELARLLLEQGIGTEGLGALVVRMGGRGCLVASHATGMVRLPAVYGPDPGQDPGDAEKVVDPTGGGNTFIGAMGVGLVRGRGVVYAAAMGNVAASFAIEQIGMPTLSSGEAWNGVNVQDRMRMYLERLGRLGIRYQD
jgi:sugar/nucleoside kinase (ribokinase family)